MENFQGFCNLIILSGWKSSKEKWEKVKNELEKESVRVIIPDMPGFKSENKLEHPWNLDNYVEWARNFIKQYTSEPIFLLGHSFGGRIAIKFASKYPEKLSGLILVSAAGITPRPKAKITIFLILSKIGHLVFSLPFLRIFRPLVEKFVYFLAGANDYRFIQETFMKQTFKKIISENLTPLLQQIKNPTLIIWGKEDKTTPLKDAYVIKEGIGDSRLEILEGVGHLPYLESPEGLSQKIIEFLKD